MKYQHEKITQRNKMVRVAIAPANMLASISTALVFRLSTSFCKLMTPVWLSSDKPISVSVPF